MADKKPTQEQKDAGDQTAVAITPEANDQDPNAARTLETGPDGAAGGGTHTITHNEEGPRGYSSAADGTVMIAPGGTVSATLTDDEVKNLKRFGIFTIEPVA